MKKVTISEKTFIIGITALVSGGASVLASVGIAGALCIGVLGGVLGSSFIGILHKVRS